MLIKIFTTITFFFIGSVLFLGTVSLAGEESPDHLARAIELYNEELYDESFDELTAQIEQNRYCALAYYYRARIRVIKKEYRTAAISLKAAFRDSSGFTDAVGLHAYILKQMGKTENALTEWRRFIEAAGSDGEETVTVDSIMLPEQYREKLDTQRKVQLKPTVTERFKTPVEQLPMAVVDFIDKKKRESATEIPQKKSLFVRSPSGIVYIILIPAGLILILILKWRISFKRREITPAAETGILEDDSSPVQYEEEEEITIIQADQEYSELLPDTPYARSLKLKGEREKHARGINRLMKKI